MSKRLALPAVVGESMIHIIEPVADQVLRYVIGRLGMTNVMKEIQIVSDFREVSNSNDVNSNAKLVDYRCVARLTPSVNPMNNKWENAKTTIDLGNGNTIVKGDGRHMKRPWSGRDITDQNFSIFHDDDLYLDMQEWNVGSTLTMEVKMDFRDLTPAQECLSRIFATFINGEMIGYCPIQYDYPIPKCHQNLLKYLYSLSGNTQTNAKFAEWLTEKSKGCISFNVNRNNLDTNEMVGLRNSANAMFLIECTQDAPEVGNNRKTVTFTLTVQYSRTNRLIFEYPVIINNTLLDAKWVPMTKDLRTANCGPFQWQNSYADAYWKQQYAEEGPIPVKCPWWDPWDIPDSIITHRGYKPIFTAALTLDDPTNPAGVTVLDLKEGLPGYKLSTEILEYLNKVKSRALYAYDTHVNISVFAHDYQVEPKEGYYETPDTKFQANKTYYSYNLKTITTNGIEHKIREYQPINTATLIGQAIPRGTCEYVSLLEFDGRYLKIRSRRLLPNYRLVISLNEKPINMPHINWVWLTTIIVKKGK